MKPFSQYELLELVEAMGAGNAMSPIGSLWAHEPTQQMFVLLFHANIYPTGEACVNLQAVPSGEVWVVNMEQFGSGEFINIGFVWDRQAVE